MLQQIREEKKLAEPVKVAAVAKKSKAQVTILTLWNTLQNTRYNTLYNTF